MSPASSVQPCNVNDVDGRNKSGHDGEMLCLSFVMPGLVPGIHVFTTQQSKTWMAGINPAMTVKCSASPSS
jgi:hypothetical protein